MPIPRPLRTHKLARRYSSLVSRLDNPVELYLTTLLINENPRDSNMEYNYNLFQSTSHEPRHESNRQARNTDCNCNKIRPMSVLSVRSCNRRDTHYGGFEGGWPFLPWKLQKIQVFIMRHLNVIWSMFMTNFHDETGEDGKRNSLGEAFGMLNASC